MNSCSVPRSALRRKRILAFTRSSTNICSTRQTAAKTRGILTKNMRVISSCRGTHGSVKACLWRDTHSHAKPAKRSMLIRKRTGKLVQESTFWTASLMARAPQVCLAQHFGLPGSGPGRWQTWP